MYSTIANEIDMQTDEGRRSLQRLFMEERDPEEEAALHNRVWLFQQLDLVRDEAFTIAGIEPTEARAHIANMIERSVVYLKHLEQRMRAFYRKYLPVVNAHKHGRALFAFVPIQTDTRFTFQASEAALTALLANRSGRDQPSRLVTFTEDEKFRQELADTLSRLEAQVFRFFAFAESVADSATLYLAVV